jgi:HSP20 family protein
MWQPLLLLTLLSIILNTMALIPSLDWYVDPRSNWIVDPYAYSGRVRSEAFQPLAPLMSADLIEKENEFQFHVDIPGVENLEITTEGNFITISADRKVTHERDTDVAHTVERSYGKVRRRLLAPNNANVDEAKARLVDGVLTLSMPKKEATTSQKKQINIE